MSFLKTLNLESSHLEESHQEQLELSVSQGTNYNRQFGPTPQVRKTKSKVRLNNGTRFLNNPYYAGTPLASVARQNNNHHNNDNANASIAAAVLQQQQQQQWFNVFEQQQQQNTVDINNKVTSISYVTCDNNNNNNSFNHPAQYQNQQQARNNSFAQENFSFTSQQFEQQPQQPVVVSAAAFQHHGRQSSSSSSNTPLPHQYHAASAPLTSSTNTNNHHQQHSLDDGEFRGDDSDEFEDRSHVQNDNKKSRNYASGISFVVVNFKHELCTFQCSFFVNEGDWVVVQADRGEHVGRIRSVSANPPPFHVPSHILRLANFAEISSVEANRPHEDYAAKRIQEISNDLKLDIRITDTEFYSDGNKMTVFFSAKNSVDFRELQRRVFREFRRRIWLINNAEVQYRNRNSRNRK